MRNLETVMTATLLHVGTVSALEMAQYRALDALSHSDLKRIRVSPYHYRASKMADAPNKKSSPQQFAGTLAHCAFLEPDCFDARYPVGPDVSKNSNAWKSFVEQHIGSEIISARDREVAFAQAAKLAEHPEITRMLSWAGESEVSFFWMEDDVPCKARADRVTHYPEPNEGAVLLDVKTTGDARPEAFARSIANFGYHIQAAFYARGWHMATGEHVHGVVFGVVENEFPYACACYALDDVSLQAANAECDRLVQVYRQCRDADRWPGYSDAIEPISLPRWALEAPAPLV